MSIKRTIIAAIVGLTLVALVAPGAAQGVTIDELLAQIATLQAQLVALQGGATPATSTAACTGVTFTRALTIGSTGTDVKCLQSLLNSNGYTVATTGVGSAGMETSYFGSLTLAAVQQFQAAKGWTPANQVGPLTRAALNTLVTTTPGTTTPTTPGVTTPGAEGSITVTKSVSPISGIEMNVGQSNVAVAAVDVKATGSDVVVNRLDVHFTSVSETSCNVRPWTMISAATISDGTTSKSVAVTSANTTEVTIGSDYMVRVEGLNMLVSKDTTKKITLSVDSAGLPVGATTCTPTIQFGINAVRATDGAGISQTGPSSALSTSTFVITTGDTGTLTVSTNTDNPKARNVIVQETAQTDDVVLMKFDVKAKNNDVILRTVRIQANSSDTLATVLPTVKLLDGTTELASTSTAATSTFSNLSVTIPKDTTKTFTVMGTISRQDTNFSEGTWVSANLTATDISGEDASTFATVTASGSNLDPANAYMYLQAPTFALVSSSIVNVAGTSGSTSQAADAVIRFNVTATGADIYVRNYSSTAASSGVVAQAQDSATGTVAQTFTTNATAGTYAWKVSAGDTKYFEVTTRITNETEYAVGYYAGLEVLDVKWGTSDVDVDGSYYTQTWGITDLETSKAYLNLRS